MKSLAEGESPALTVRVPADDGAKLRMILEYEGNHTISTFLRSHVMDKLENYPHLGVIDNRPAWVCFHCGDLRVIPMDHIPATQDMRTCGGCVEAMYS